MAGADTAKVKAEYEDIAVPDELIHGGKFIKWEQDSTTVVPVTLKVDPKGYFLYWKDQKKPTAKGDGAKQPDVDCLELAQLRDARNSKYAVVPKDGKVRDTCFMGAQDENLEEKAVTVVTGADMVNVSFLTFFSNSSQLAELWARELLRMAYSRANRTPSKFQLLERMYVKLTILVNREGKIPVKTLKKMLANSRDDKKRIDDVLQASSIHHSDGCIDPKKFTFQQFFTFYLRLVHERDVDRVFQELGAKNKPYLTKEQIVKFLNDGQRDPRLNEILYPYHTEQDAITLIKKYENNQAFARKGHLSSEGLAHYLMSHENSVIPPESYILWQDMDQPMSQYFINSSHNTYLIGHQFTGKSSVEIYRQVLLGGCRCIELDCWDGEDEPVITHGRTMCTEIPFKEVIEAIDESAFKTSDYPLILSFENHCTPKIQAKMASYCRTIFGDKLLVDPLDEYPLESGVPLPSPSELKGKILVKNKKRKRQQPVDNPKRTAGKVSSSELDSKPSEPVEEEESDSDDDGETDKKDQGTAGQEAEAGEEMSALVNYLQPVHFHSFEIAQKNNKSFEITSFVETSAMNKVKEKPAEFVHYNKRQLSRIYPKGTRVDSSNYMPQIFWNVGCQLVALNFQTLDLPMQLNLGIFELNGGSGFILKPDFMRQKERQFDPFAETTMDGIVAATLEMKVISGQFLSDRRIGSYVEIDMYGLPHDTVRKKHRTKVVSGNGLNPLYDDKSFKFNKIIMPKLAMMKISVIESSSNRIIGHRILPVETLRPGYRHICLRNESNQVLMLPSLFVHIKVSDYVPDGFADFAEALSNPIAHISEIDRRARMLDELTADTEITDSADSGDQSDPQEAGTEATGTEDAQASAPVPSATPATPATPARGSTAGSTPVTAKMSTTSYNKKTPADVSFSSGTPRKISKNPLNQKISAIDTISMDSSISLEDIEAATADEVKQHKKYLKLVQQQAAQLDKLIKKQEKKQSKLKKSQAKDIAKLRASHTKGVKGQEKKNTSHEKKELKKKHGDVEKVRRQSASSMDSLKKEQEEEVLKKQVHHEDILIQLYRKHYEEEKHLKIAHANQLFDLHLLLMEKLHSKQLKDLEKQQKKEEGDMRKMMEKHNLDQRRHISSADGDSHEIQRVRNEAKKKQIGQTVQFTKELRQRHTEKRDELQKKMLQLQEQLSDQSETYLDKIEEEFRSKEEKLAQERRYQRLASNGNGNSQQSPAAAPKEPSKEAPAAMENHTNGNIEGNGTKGGTHADVHVAQSPNKTAQQGPSENGENGEVKNGQTVNPEDGTTIP